MKVKEIMADQTISFIHKHNTIYEAAEKMKEMDIGDLPVNNMLEIHDRPHGNTCEFIL